TSTPHISLSPTKKVTYGKKVKITYSVETKFTGGSLTLIQSTGSLRETKSGTSITFSLPKVDFDHEGPCYCQYQARVSVYPRGSFHLKLNGSSINRTESVDHSATFLLTANYVHQGNYSCVYEVAVSSCNFSSPPTELLEVSVKESPAPFIGFGVAAGLLLILVPVIIVIIRRCRKQKYQMPASTEHGLNAESTFRDTGGMNETDDDEVYINVQNTEAVFQQREDSDDSGEDYVNVVGDTGNSTVANDYAGAKTTTNNEMDDGDEDYENTEAFVLESENSEVTDDDYINVDAEI
ncbi:hypothetical protein NFI96_025018, partial [Prochilodus magdalenae]